MIQSVAGFRRLEGITDKKTDNRISLREMHWQAKTDYRDFKSIRRPLAPERSRHTTSSSVLQFRGESTIPQPVKREIIKRQTMRLENTRQERLDRDKQRGLQLEDTVGVYTRISLSKGNLKYKGRTTYR